MTRHEHVRQAVSLHRWLDLADWCAAVAELADLSDEELDEIAGETRPVTLGEDR